MFLFYLKKLLRCPATYAAALLFFCSIVFSLSGYPEWSNPRSYWNPIYLYEISVNLGVAAWFIPVAAVVPICFVRKELSRGSTWQFPLLRANPCRFTLGGLAAACISGAAVTLLGLALFFLVGFLRSRGTLVTSYTLLGSCDWPAGDFRLGRSYLEVTLIELAGLVGMSVLPAGAAYLISGFTDNQYLCAALPFLLYTLALYSFQRLAYYVNPVFRLFDPARMNPMGNPFDGSPYAPLYPLLYGFAVLLICALLFRLRLNRRLRDG